MNVKCRRDTETYRKLSGDGFSILGQAHRLTEFYEGGADRFAGNSE